MFDEYKRVQIFIILLIILGCLLVWFMPGLMALPLYLKIIITGGLLFSLYYQLMTWREQIDPSSLNMTMDDRIRNELGYQVTKRGYYIKFDYKTKNNESILYVRKTNCPKWKRFFIKIHALAFVILAPAWHYREYDEEDEIDYNPYTDSELQDAKPKKVSS